jgi:hypothetical protein
MPSIRPLAILLSNHRRMPSPVALDGMRGVDDRRQAAVRGPEIPALQERGRLFGRILLVELLKGEPYLVGSCGLQMTRWKIFQGLALPAGQVGWVAQPDISGAAQQTLPLLCGAAHLIDGVVDDLMGCVGSQQSSGCSTSTAQSWPIGASGKGCPRRTRTLTPVKACRTRSSAHRWLTRVRVGREQAGRGVVHQSRSRESHAA